MAAFQLNCSGWKRSGKSWCRMRQCTKHPGGHTFTMDAPNWLPPSSEGKMGCLVKTQVVNCGKHVHANIYRPGMAHRAAHQSSSPARTTNRSPARAVAVQGSGAAAAAAIMGRRKCLQRDQVKHGECSQVSLLHVYFLCD